MQRLFFIFIATLLSSAIYGQNNVRLSISEADNIFLSQNLNLLAQQYNIDKAEAMLIQAGLFENPTVNFEQIAYNSENKQYFNTRSQHVIEIEQVIAISGKRAKQKEIERYNIEIARQEFEMMLRELKYALRSNLIDAAYTQKSISIFDKEIEHLDRLIKVYDIQYNKGNVSLIEKSRLEALLFAIKSEQLEYISKQNEIQTQLRLLLNFKQDIVIVADLGTFEINPFLLNISQFQSFIDNNPQIRIAEIQTKQERRTLLCKSVCEFPMLH